MIVGIDELLDTSAGALVWIALVGASAFAIFRVWTDANRYTRRRVERGWVNGCDRRPVRSDDGWVGPGGAQSRAAESFAVLGANPATVAYTDRGTAI